MRFTCSLCWNEGIYNETYLGSWGLCSAHYKEYTITGSTPLPEWLKIFSHEHHRQEKRIDGLALNEIDMEGRSLGRGGNTTKATKSNT